MDKQLKTIKITERAHRGLSLAKALDSINMTQWASTVILEALEKDCPRAYEELRREVIREEEGAESSNSNLENFLIDRES